jgi:HEAT repeat protein
MNWRVVVLAAAAGATASATSSQLPLPVQNVLTTIDSVPTQGQLDSAFSDHQSALAGLAALAADPTAAPSIRLHAIHALTKYCATAPCIDGDVAHQTLVGLVTANQDQAAGTALVVLRGALEALGPQRVGTDLGLLVAQLAHPSRDVRTAAVHALRDLCNTQAINPLRVQLQHELSDQVRLAISEALRILGQPQPCQ